MEEGFAVEARATAGEMRNPEGRPGRPEVRVESTRFGGVVSEAPRTAVPCGAARSSGLITGFVVPLAVADIGQRGCCTVGDVDRVTDSDLHSNSTFGDRISEKDSRFVYRGPVGPAGFG